MGQVLRLGGRTEALDHLAVAADEELGEVPLDALGPQQARRLFFQLHEQWMGIAAIDVDLLEQREADTEVQLAEFGNRPFVTGLLLAELVARKAQYHQALVLVLLPELLQALVLRGEAAFAGGVDHEDGLAGEIGQGLLLTLDGGARDAQQVVAHGSASIREKEDET